MIKDEASARTWLKTLPEYNDNAQGQLERLSTLLIAENGRQNLVSASSLEHIWQRHIADSAQLLLHVPRETGAKWLDLGTGAGFPGIVDAILRPEATFLLVESRPRRTAWLKQVALELKLPNIYVIGSRLELRQSELMSVISARAFAPLHRLLELSARFSDNNTWWLLPKGRSAAHELAELSGWQHMFHVEQSLTDPDAGLIVGRLIGRTRQGK